MSSKNPYLAKKAPVELDKFEAKTRGYRFATKKLLEGIQKVEGKIIDLGSGTANSTLEISSKYRGSDNQVTAVEQGKEAHNLALMKFGLSTIDFSNIEDEKLTGFFLEFRKEAMPLNDRVKFHLRNVQDVDDFFEGKAGLVVGNHLWHWLVKQGVEDKALLAVKTVLNGDGILAINTSSHLMMPVKYDIKDTSIFHHPLMRRFFESLQRKAKERAGLDIPMVEHPEPIFERENLIKKFEAAGFELVEYDEYLISVGHDPETGEDNFREGALMLSNYHMKYHAKNRALYDLGLNDAEMDAIVETARTETLENIGNDLEHQGHIYDVNPKFVFKKRKY